MTPNKRDLKSYARFDGTGRIVPGSLVLRRTKPKNGNWKEIPAYECCNDVTLKTTVATTITNFKVRFYCNQGLSNELLSSTGWTSTGWTGSYEAGFTHTTGNTTALSNTFAAVVNNVYQLVITVTGRTAGSFTAAFGGVSTAGITATTTIDVTASTTGALTITPLTAFDGNVVVSIKQVTGLVYTLASSQNSSSVADLVTRLNTTYPTVGVFSTEGGTNLTLVMTDDQNRIICNNTRTSFTVTT
jgi:hypothetical protein